VDDRAGDWIVETNEVDRRFHTIGEVLGHLEGLEAQPSGQASVRVARVPVTGWKRFLGVVGQDSPCFAVEWDGPYASLIFHDDAWSEYRAIDESHPVQPTEDQRRRIAHGELTPHPLEECMDKARAFTAMREYFGGRARPSWLKYRYIR